MRYATLARWSNQSSVVHRFDVRVKLLLLLAFVISLTLLRAPSAFQLMACLLYLLIIAWLADLPLLRLLQMSLFVVPFVGLFSMFLYFAGDASRAWFILAKSYLSAVSVLVLISSTPLPRLVEAGRYFHVPDLLLEVIQLTYRYLFVLSSQAHAMQIAFHTRAGRAGRRAIRASSGMVAVLFSRSYEKATMVQQAMLARGFSGTLTHQKLLPMRGFEIGTLAAGLLFTFALRFV